MLLASMATKTGIHQRSPAERLLGIVGSIFARLFLPCQNV
jgi:hypothetical protein